MGHCLLRLFWRALRLFRWPLSAGAAHVCWCVDGFWSGLLGPSRLGVLGALRVSVGWEMVAKHSLEGPVMTVGP